MGGSDQPKLALSTQDCASGTSDLQIAPPAALKVSREQKRKKNRTERRAVALNDLLDFIGHHQKARLEWQRNGEGPEGGGGREAKNAVQDIVLPYGYVAAKRLRRVKGKGKSRCRKKKRGPLRCPCLWENGHRLRPGRRAKEKKGKKKRKRERSRWLNEHLDHKPLCAEYRDGELRGELQ